MVDLSVFILKWCQAKTLRGLLLKIWLFGHAYVRRRETGAKFDPEQNGS
jgi:hypothetical protein